MNDYGYSSHRSTGDWVIGAAKRNPEALLVLAAGCALLLRGGANRRERDSSDAYGEDSDFRFSGEQPRRRGAKSRRMQSLREGISDVREGISDAVETASDAVSSAAEQVTETASAYASTVSRAARDGSHAVSSRAVRWSGQAQSTAGDVIREQPWAVALLGIGAGAALAALLPPSDVEERTLAPARDAVADAARRAVDSVKEAAGETATKMQHEATMRAASGLTEMARDAAKTFTGSMAGEDQGTDKSRGAPE